MTTKFNIFEDKTPMPGHMTVSPDVVRSAVIPAQVHENMMPAAMPDKRSSVQNIERPRRGYGY